MPTSLTWTATKFLGQDSTSSPEEIGPQPGKPGPTYLVAADNMRFNKRGSAYTRKGIEQKIDLGTSVKVNSMGAHENAMFAKSNTGVYYSTNEWATKTLVGSLTRTAAEIDFFYPRQDEMYLVNETDGLTWIDDSYSATTQAGVTGTCIAELEGSMLIGSGRSIKYSAPSTIANPEFFRDFSGNGAGAKETPSTVKCMKGGAGIVLVGMTKGLSYAYAFEVDTGALLTRDIQDQESQGTPSKFCICYVGNNTFAVFTGRRVLLVIADAGGVRVVENLFNDKRSFDYPISADLQAGDSDQSLSWTHFNSTTKFLYVCYFRNGVPRIKVCDMASGAWSEDTGKNFSCMVNWKFRAYAGDDTTSLIYLDDEGQTDNGSAIRHRLVLPAFGIPNATCDYLGIKYSGLLSAEGAYTHRFYTTGNGTETLSEDIEAEDLVDERLMSTSSGVPIGEGAIGADGIGSGGETPEGFRFRYPWEFLFIGETGQPEIEINTEGTSMELRRITVEAETEGELEFDSQ